MKHTTMQAAALSIVLLGCGILLLAAQPAHSANANSATPPDDSAASAIYTKHCATCHGKDGRAKTFKAKFNHARNLTDAVWQADVSDEHLYNSIAQGKGKMPAFGRKFSAAELNALVAYVRHFRQQQ